MLGDGGLGHRMEEDEGIAEEQRDEGRVEEGGSLWRGSLLFRRRWKDLTLLGRTRLWLLRRRPSLYTGPVPVLLKGSSDLETQAQSCSRSK